jgi:hypothetical protein
MRAFADRVYRGSKAVGLGMARGTVAWFKEGSGPGDFLVRLAFLLGGLALLWGFVQTAPVLMFPLTVWWVIAAYRKGKSGEPEEKAAVPPLQESSEPAQPKDDSPEALAAHPPRVLDLLLALVRPTTTTPS